MKRVRSKKDVKVSNKENVQSEEIRDAAEFNDAEGECDDTGILPVAEDFSALREEELQGALADIRRKSDANGGYITFEEINRMLPQHIVDAVETERCLEILDQLRKLRHPSRRQLLVEYVA